MYFLVHFVFMYCFLGKMSSFFSNLFDFLLYFQLEQFFGSGRDVEWALCQDTIYLLQVSLDYFRGPNQIHCKAQSLTVIVDSMSTRDWFIT